MSEVGGRRSEMGIIKCFNRECRYHDLNELAHCSKPLTEIRECPDAEIRKVTGKSWNSYFDALMSNGCVCGKKKQPKKSFCYSCFMLLPQDLKNDLYSRLGEGYEQAYDAAVMYLEDMR